MPRLKRLLKTILLKWTDKILANDMYVMFNGDNFFFVLWDLDRDFFRNNLKYNPKDLSEEQLEILDKGRDYLYELMEKYGVDFDHVE